MLGSWTPWWLQKREEERAGWEWSRRSHILGSIP